MKKWINGIIISMLMAFLPIGAQAAPTNEPGIILTFDDFFPDMWHSYFLERDDVDLTDVKVTFFVSNWHEFSSDEVEKLRNLGDNGHEIACHTYNHRGVSAFGYDPERIEEYLAEQIRPAIDNMNADGFYPVSFSYPYGERNAAYDSAIKQYLPNIRGGHSDYSTPLEEHDPLFHNSETSYDILRGDGIDNAYNQNINDVFEALNRAKNNNEIITLYAHRIVEDAGPDANHDYGIKVSVLTSIINKAKELGLRFYTFEEGFNVGNTVEYDSDNVTTAVSGDVVNISYTGLANTFIGILPADQNEWQAGIPGIETTGSANGEVEITVPDPVDNQDYKAALYANGVLVATSKPFIIRSNYSDDVTVTVEGNRVRLRWTNIPSDFVGIVPANLGSWEGGMAGAYTGGGSSGNMGITVDYAEPGVLYTAVYYNNFDSTREKAATSAPFIIIEGGTPAPVINAAVVDGGVQVTWSHLANTFVGIVPADQTDWAEGMPSAVTDGSADGEVLIPAADATPGASYVAMFYNSNGDKVGASSSFIIVENVPEPTLSAVVEAGGVRVTWSHLANTRIGIVPANLPDWTAGMPSAVTDGSADGEVLIAVPEAIEGQAYVAMIYNGVDKVGTSSAFIINPVDPGISYIPLVENGFDNTEYGWRYGTNENPENIIFGFYGIRANHILRLKGYDMDSGNEACLYLNNNFLGCLSGGSNNQLTPELEFNLPVAYQQSAGNILEIRVKKYGLKWGITQIGMFANAEPPAAPAIKAVVQDGNMLVAWSAMSNDLIGIVPMGQPDWLTGMPFVATDGSADGEVLVPTADAIPGQAYVAMAYNGGAKVGTTSSFVIIPDTPPAAYIPLIENGYDNTEYGWRYGSNEHREGVILGFTGIRSAHHVRLKAYDTDSATETCLYLNDNPLGCMAARYNNQLTPEQQFSLPAAYQISGDNILEVRAKKAGIKWGITQIGIFPDE